MEIAWDEWAVPTVTGRDDRDVTYGMGYAQAVTNAGLVLELYGIARGNAASLWGTNFVADDRLTCELGLAATTRTWVAAQPESTLRRLAAFCAGFNAACAADGTLGGERREALPVTPQDVVAHCVRVFARFTTIDFRGLAFSPTAFVESAGSNAWAVSGRRSTNGDALLVINPHLMMTGYQRFFEAHSVSPGRDVHGVTLMGLPWQVMGYTPDVGWAHTVNPVPNMSVYRLDLDGDGYRFDGRTVPLDTTSHTVAVRGADPVTVLERRSVHGPVVTAPDGAEVAVRVAGVLHHPATGALETWWRMSLATSVADLFAIHDAAPLPMFNAVAADARGSVGALYCGTPPMRSAGTIADTRRRLPGDDPRWIWDAVHPPSAMPRVIDPDCGWVQNCNEQPWFFTDPLLDPEAHPAAISPGPDELPELRAVASRAWLTGQDSIGSDDLLGLKFGKRALLADLVLDELCDAAAADDDLAEAVSVLRSWDRQARHDSKGYVLFSTWSLLNTPSIIERTLLLPPTEPGGKPRGLADSAAAVGTLRDAVAMLGDLGTSLDAAIGQVCTLGDGADAVAADGGSSQLGMFKALDLLPGPDGFRPGVADSWISLVEFRRDGPPIARNLLVYGNTTEPGAPAARSQYALWAADRLRPR